MTNALPGFERLYAWNEALMNAPAGLLVFVACLLLGYALKVWELFPNRHIPKFVLPSGALLFPGLTHVWSVRQITLGFILSCAAWLFHHHGLKRLEQKLGWFQAPSEPSPPPKHET